MRTASAGIRPPGRAPSDLFGVPGSADGDGWSVPHPSPGMPFVYHRAQRKGAVSFRWGVAVLPSPSCVFATCTLVFWNRREYAPKCTVRLLENVSKLLKRLVGAGRFERPTPCAQGRCATGLRYAPTFCSFIEFRTLSGPAIALRIPPVPTSIGTEPPWTDSEMVADRVRHHQE